MIGRLVYSIFFYISYVINKVMYDNKNINKTYVSQDMLKCQLKLN